MNKNLGYIKDKQEFFKAVKKDSFLRFFFLELKLWLSQWSVS